MTASVRSETVTQQLDWCTHRAAHFVFHYLANSYAATYLPWLSRRAERAWDTLQAWHAHDEASSSPIDIYLVPLLAHPERPQEKLTHGAYADTAARRVWAVCHPESPAEGLEAALAHLIIFQQLGPAAGQVPFLRAGLVASLLGQPAPSPLIEPATGATQEYDQRTIVNITGWMAERSIVNQRQYTPIASAFIAFLADEYGVSALQDFIHHYDPATPDIGAVASFQAPLRAIVERWITIRYDNNEPCLGVSKLLWRLLPYTRPYTGQVIVIMAYMVIALGFALGLQLSIKFLIDNVIAEGNVRLLSEMLVAGLIAYIVNAVVSLRRAYLIAWVSERIILRLRLDVFTHLHSLSAAFYGRARLGDIISRLSVDIVIVQVALSQALLGGLFYVLSLVCAAIILFLLDWRLAAVVLIAVPILFVGAVALSARVVRASRERAECLADLTDILQESLSAQAVVRAFGLHEYVVEQFNHGLQRLFHRAVRVMLFGSLFRLLTDLITSLIQLLTLGIGAYLLLTGNLSLGAMFSFIGLLSAVTSPIENISELNQSLQQAAGSMQRIVELLDEQPDILDVPDAVSLPRLAEELRFDRVWFSHSPDRHVLQDVSFVIPAGTHVAIVGPSGAGKSSVINLLMRFYDPQRGRILLDGVDLRTGTQESLRKQIGVVSQDTFLFNTTIWKNLAYGRLDASEDEIVSAARDAEIHEFISSLPDGYATVVGDRGARLSGGQRQRLAIARALVRRPSILLLDEATSALDPETELHIHATLSRIAERLTTMMVTHRLASAASADHILLLDRGLLVEQGTHADLMAAGGLYARLYAEQHSGILAGSAAMRQIDRLRRVPLFAALPVEVLAAVDRELQLERYASGDTIVRQGEAGDKLYILDRGRVEVIIERGAGEYRLNVLSDSDYFGEIALLHETPRTATVRALGPVQVLALGKADFQRLFQQMPDVAQRFGVTVERRLAEQRSAIAGA